MCDVITIGSATMDVFVESDDANIVSVYFFGEELHPYIGINNNNVLSNLEKSLKDNIGSSVFINNHFNILNDIETFIYECDVQKLCTDDINIDFLTNNIDSNIIINISEIETGEMIELS